MSFQAPQYSPELTQQLKIYSKVLIKLLPGARTRHMAMRDAMDVLMVREGMTCTRKIGRLFLPHGVNYEDHVERIRDRTKVLARELGLGTIVTAGSMTLLHNATRLLGFIRTEYTPTYINFIVNGIEEGVIGLYDAIIEEFGKETPVVVARIIQRDKTTGLDTKQVTLPPPSTPVDHRILYPQFNTTPAELWSEFAASNSNVLLLIGPPGLGKSSFIRAMLDARGWEEESKVYVADRTDVLLNQGLSDFIRNAPRQSVVITEDSDVIVAKREDGNSNMAALLNMASGIIPTDTKLIISTNLPNLRRVDEALLRPGRMFRVLEFKPLTLDQAHAIRDHMELPTVDFGKMQEITLAEAINWHEVAGVLNKATPVGFLGK